MADTSKINITNDVDDSVQQNPQKIPRFPFLFRRFIEILVTSVICSIPFSILLYQFSFIVSSTWTFRLTCASFVVFVLINAYLLRAFYFSMGSRKIYFSVNAIAYIMFAIINIISITYFKDYMYSYMFMPINLSREFINEIIHVNNPSIEISCAILSHLIMLGVIIISPLEMYSFDKKRK